METDTEDRAKKNISKINELFDFMKEISLNAPSESYSSSYNTKTGNEVHIGIHPNSNMCVVGRTVTHIVLGTIDKNIQKPELIVGMIDSDNEFSFLYLDDKHILMRNNEGQVAQILSELYYPPEIMNEIIPSNMREKFEHAYDVFYEENMPFLISRGVSEEQLKRISRGMREVEK